MDRWINLHRSLHADPERVVEILASSMPEVLQEATGTPVSQPLGDGTIPLDLQGRVAGSTVHRTVHAHVGELRRLRDWTVVPITWEATRSTHLLPSFSGQVEVQRLSRNVVELTVSGHYRPPLGLVGDVADRTALRAVATGTLTDLVEGLADALALRLLGARPARTPHRPGALLVRDAMTADTMTLHEDDRLARAATDLLVRGVSGAPVVDDGGQVVGVLSTSDLLDRVVDGAVVVGPDDEAATVGDVCSRPALSTEADSALRDAADVMRTERVDRLTVMDGARHVGVLTRTDVLLALLRTDERIEADARAVLDEYGLTAVALRVERGVAHVAGKLQLRSETRGARELLTRVDGLLAIDDTELEWGYDDVVPVAYPLM